MTANITAKQPTLQLTHINHYFGITQILQDISLVLKAGQSLAVIGPSGGGKSTLLRLCAGLITASEGDCKNTFNDLALVFQDSRLLPWQTAKDNITFAMKARGVPRYQRDTKAHELALSLALDAHDLAKYPSELSGGMRQRVAFARAFAIDAPLMLLDEPFSALDMGLKSHLQQCVIQQVSEHDMALLFITHDLMEAVQMAQKIIVLAGNPGRILASFELDMPLPKRDDAYVYHTTAELLANPVIKHAFAINGR